MKTKTNRLLTLAITAVLVATGALWANGARDAILATYAAQVGGGAFSAKDGEAFYMGTHSGGKPNTPSCTSCHTNDPAKAGVTRAGKIIDPMAVSVAPDRFTDIEKVEKWFGRNCNSVVGRACSAQEKGDILSYLLTL